jgi:hypothetical protein
MAVKDLQRAWTCCLFIIAGPISAFGFQYHANNDVQTETFPGQVHTSDFSIPLSSRQLTVIYPATLAAHSVDFQRLLNAKCECRISFVAAEDVPTETLKNDNLVLLGNMSDNKWLLDLYKKRYAFADAYFPGLGGYAIHPAKSIWNRSKNILVIEASDDQDLLSGFNAFVASLPSQAQHIGPVRKLKTLLAFPAAPATVEPLLERSKTNPHVDMPPYSAIADWGLAYHLTGDRKRGEDFLAGLRVCFERAQATGQWVPEQWTNVYFNLWKLIYTWDLIDNDPCLLLQIAEWWTRFFGDMPAFAMGCPISMSIRPPLTSHGRTTQRFSRKASSIRIDISAMNMA